VRRFWVAGVFGASLGGLGNDLMFNVFNVCAMMEYTMFLEYLVMLSSCLYAGLVRQLEELRTRGLNGRKCMQKVHHVNWRINAKKCISGFLVNCLAPREIRDDATINFGVRVRPHGSAVTTPYPRRTRHGWTVRSTMPCGERPGTNVFIVVASSHGWRRRK
jgi:hypothetical protein